MLLCTLWRHHFIRSSFSVPNFILPFHQRPHGGKERGNTYHDKASHLRQAGRAYANNFSDQQNAIIVGTHAPITTRMMVLMIKLRCITRFLYSRPTIRMQGIALRARVERDQGADWAALPPARAGWGD